MLKIKEPSAATAYSTAMPCTPTAVHLPESDGKLVHLHEEIARLQKSKA